MRLLCGLTTYPQAFSLIISPPSLSVATVHLKNFLSSGPLINVPCFLSLADKLFLLTDLAAGDADTSCPRTQSLFGWAFRKGSKNPFISEISQSLEFLVYHFYRCCVVHLFNEYICHLLEHHLRLQALWSLSHLVISECEGDEKGCWGGPWVTDNFFFTVVV